MILRDRLARLAAAVRACLPRHKPSPIADEMLHCRSCNKLVPMRLVEPVTYRAWYYGYCLTCFHARPNAPTGIPQSESETPFPTREHMNVRQEDLDALQEDWKSLCRDGAASRGEGETQNKGETP